MNFSLWFDSTHTLLHRYMLCKVKWTHSLLTRLNLISIMPNSNVNIFFCFLHYSNHAIIPCFGYQEKLSKDKFPQLSTKKESIFVIKKIKNNFYLLLWSIYLFKYSFKEERVTPLFNKFPSIIPTVHLCQKPTFI